MQKRNPKSRRQIKKRLKRIKFQVFHILGLWVTLAGTAALVKWLFDLVVQQLR